MRTSGPPPGDRLALPDDRDLVAVAVLDLPVDAVVAEVRLAADEPLRVGELPLEDGVPRLEPVELPATSPQKPSGSRIERSYIARYCVHRADVRAADRIGEPRRGREDPAFLQDGLDRAGVVRGIGHGWLTLQVEPKSIADRLAAETRDSLDSSRDWENTRLSRVFPRFSSPAAAGAAGGFRLRALAALRRSALPPGSGAGTGAAGSCTGISVMRRSIWREATSTCTIWTVTMSPIPSDRPLRRPVSRPVCSLTSQRSLRPAALRQVVHADHAFHEESLDRHEDAARRSTPVITPGNSSPRWCSCRNRMTRKLRSSRSASSASCSVSEQWRPSSMSWPSSSTRGSSRSVRISTVAPAAAGDRPTVARGVQERRHHPVDQQIRIPPDRAREVRVVLRGQRVVPDQGRTVRRLAERAEHREVNGAGRRRLARRVEQLLHVLSACGSSGRL